MGRSKLEQEFERKLKEREIAPSVGSWDRLEALLDQAETKQQKKKTRVYWNIAAAVVGVLLVSGIFMKMQTETSHAIEPTIYPSQNEVTLQEQAATQNEAQNQVDSAPEEEVIIQKSAYQQYAAYQPKKEKSIADSAEKVAESRAENAPLVPSTESNSEVLLASVREKIDNRAKDEIKVDARMLLDNVDEEKVELNKRQKLMRALNRNYQSVKVALENRNLEESH